MTNSQHVYEIRPRKDHHGVDLIAFVTFFVCAACECAAGADAVFSKDGQHIYGVAWEAPEGTAQLRHIDLSKRTINLIPLKELSGDLRGICSSDNQDILCATATELWRYHPTDGRCTKVCDVSAREPVDLTSAEDSDAANHREFTDVGYNPKTRAILLSTEVVNGTETINGLWLLNKGQSKPRPRESTAETQPQLQPALLRLSAMISQ